MKILPRSLLSPHFPSRLKIWDNSAERARCPSGCARLQSMSIIKKEKVSYFLNAQKIPKKKIQELFAPFLKHLATKRGEELSQENLLFILDGYCEFRSSIHQQKLNNYHQSFIQYQKSKKKLEALERESLQIYELK